MSNTKEKPFVEGLTIASLLGLTKEKEAKEVERKGSRYGWSQYDYRTEILDEKEGYVYEKKRGNKKGKRLRKFFEALGRGYSDERACFWRPKLDDLAYCEAKRWKAQQYKQNQYKKIIGAFDLVLKNTPFSCIRITKNYPGFAWVEFPHYDHEPRGVSWDWWESNYRNKNKTDKPPSPLKQDVGDAWFYYEDRSRELRQRVSYFELLFHMALEKRYSQAVYMMRNSGSQSVLKLVINGREYIVGCPDGRSFGVIAYPENIINQVIEPGNMMNQEQMTLFGYSDPEFM